MLRSFILFQLIFILTFNYVISVSSWKPIASPATYVIHQSHPSIGSVSHTSNSISTDDDTTGIAGSGGHHGSTLIGHDSDIDYHGFKNDGRILTGLGEPVYGEEDACSVDKYAFDHEGTVQYRNKLPKMDQYTICFWMRFTNHSGDHTLLTYSVDGEPREIQLWVANAKGSSYISMAIHGQQIFRLNYPLKMRKWHHVCSSWNGKTGEWQLWVKAERVGRGFHNRLVGYHIPAHGLLYTGGPSITGHIADGLHFEFTLLQIYKVALSAGKAHRDHKHHHVHHFNHDGVATTTTLPPPRNRPSPLPMNPNLANGQIPTRVRINLANPAQQQQNQQQPSVQGVPSQLIGGSLPLIQGGGGGGGVVSPQATISTNFINGQFHTNSRLIAQQLASNGIGQRPSGSILSSQLSSVSLQPQPSQQTPTLYIHAAQPASISTNSFSGVPSAQFSSAIQFPADTSSASLNPNSQSSSGSSSSSLLFDPNPNTSRFVFKRETVAKTSSSTNNKTKTIRKRDTMMASKTKRGLVMLNDGSVVDDTLLAHGYEFQGLAKFGHLSFKQNLDSKSNLEDEIKEHDKEPAEEEVKAVMQLCTSCDSEPFKGAIVFAWNDAKTIQDGTLKGRSVGGCGYF
ncbi:uncharacterized protein LOC129618459 [Condylostylus longicornis]|uniref:uncharacterized protein LOC129618459 n=1 Tax=Condylostylus longicornis TaxID=2530218 RepID=UPI00244E59B8|nr:uncharacterized protein LOC129618459 [Condylostylus longicornis]